MTPTTRVPKGLRWDVQTAATWSMTFLFCGVCWAVFVAVAGWFWTLYAMAFLTLVVVLIWKADEHEAREIERKRRLWESQLAQYQSPRSYDKGEVA